jgi:DNA-binding NarL/FixJ family response regulator
LIQAAIYDPQLLSSEGIKTILEQNKEINNVEILDTTKTLSSQLASSSPDLIVLDYSSFKGHLAAEIEETIKSFPLVNFLVITDNQDPIMVRKFISMGVKGFLTKQCSVEEIQTALKLIQDGGKFYCQSVIEIITDENNQADLDLSDREMEIINHVTKGESSTEIANNLNVSIHTVNSHRKNILKKLGLKSPTELIIYAIKQGWVKV